MTDFWPLTVTEVRRETADSVAVTLAPPEEAGDVFRYRAGQHLTFRKVFDGEEHRRTYSIAASVAEATLRVGVRQVEGGVFSTHMNRDLQPGDRLEALPPGGTFGEVPDPQSVRHGLAMAAGSGITPLLGITATLLESVPEARVTLVYGNRTRDSVMFLEAISDLKDRYPERLAVVHILSRERGEVDLFHGRINEEKLRELFRYWVDPGTVDVAFLCGPLPMMDGSRTVLEETGLAAERIRSELFDTQVAPEPRPLVEASAGEVEATVVLDGTSRRFRFPRGEGPLLELVEREGLHPPYACRNGVCATCRARILEGTAELAANFALSENDLAEGLTLTCQCYPTSRTIVVDYDG